MRYGTKIITNGLVFCLDAADINSYNGSGSIWYDIGPHKIEMDKAGGTQTPHEKMGGAWAFNFNNSGYWQSSTSEGQLIDLRYDSTLEFWLYAETIGERDTIFQKNPIAYNSYEEELAMTWETSGKINSYRARNTYDAMSNAGPTLNNNSWNYFVVQLPTWTVGTRLMYQFLNGSNAYENSLKRSTSISQAGALRIGSGYAGTMEAGGIGICRIYNRLLSQSEMLSNFNAQKMRFNLI